MKLSSDLVLVLVLVLSGYAIGRAQTDNNNSIELGNTYLHLGMAKDSVIAALSTSYNIDGIGLVNTKSGPPYDNVGQVVFKNGKLTQVWKNWSPIDQQKGYEFANNIYGLFKGIEDEGRTNCALSTASKQKSGSEEKTVFLSCGGKEINISTLRWRQGDQMNESGMLTEIFKLKE